MNTRIKIIGLLAILLSVSAITWAIQVRYFKQGRKPVIQQKAQWAVPVYDKVLLEKLERLGKHYDTLKQAYTIKGTISMRDKADTVSPVKNVVFIYCKKGKELYYRLGETETINANGMYLYIDHPARRILVARQKDVSEAPVITDMTRVVAGLKSEYYDLSGSVSGSVQTLSLRNEHHISCKQYTVAYDTLSYAIRHIYARLNDPQDPLNRKKENVMQMDLSEWDGKAALATYTVPEAVIRRYGSKWRTTEKYKGYELIDTTD